MTVDTDPSCRSPSLRSVPFKTEHEQSLLSLHRRVFNAERTMEFLRWRRHSADGKEAITQVLCATDSPNVRAHFSIHPTRWNMLGRPIWAGQVLDTLTDPDAPMPREFRSNVDRCIERATESGLLFMFGFPNEKGVPLMVKHHACIPVVHLRQYFLRLAPPPVALFRNAPWLRRIGASLMGIGISARFRVKRWLYRKALGGTFRVERSAEPPHDYEKFWNRVKSRYLLSRWKDTAYLRWRYRSPVQSFDACRFYALYRNGSMEAFAVVVVRKGIAYLTELMANDFDVPTARLLFYDVVLDTVRRPVDVLCFAGIDAGFLERTLEDMHQRPAWDLLLMVRYLSPNKELPVFNCVESWSLTTGDTDVL
jgi:hypothetical protein